jgi:uncharacterized phage-associated protein
MINIDSLLVKSGKIIIYRLYDVAYEINLLRVEERLQKESRRLKIEKKPFSKAFEFANPPITFQLKGFRKEIRGEIFDLNVYSKIYDYGVISIILEVPVKEKNIYGYEALAFYLGEDEEIDGECKKKLEQVIEILADAFVGFSISKFEEDYTIFFIEDIYPQVSFREFLEKYDIARLLFYEKGILSQDIKDELISLSFSYFNNDGVVLNWDNAFVIEPSGSTDIPDILEFANSQLLELRYYDSVVDKELNQIYENMSKKGALSIWKIKEYEKFASRIMKTITDLTEITEKIDSSLKVTEDVYYAKIYRAALRLFRVKEWEGGVKKKLDIVSGICDMLYREIANKRLELLELIIVLLIAIDIIIWLL